MFIWRTLFQWRNHWIWHRIKRLTVKITSLMSPTEIGWFGCKSNYEKAFKTRGNPWRRNNRWRCNAKPENNHVPTLKMNVSTKIRYLLLWKYAVKFIWKKNLFTNWISGVPKKARTFCKSRNAAAVLCGSLIRKSLPVVRLIFLFMASATPKALNFQPLGKPCNTFWVGVPVNQHLNRQRY
jgi:hypothetical protein